MINPIKSQAVVKTLSTSPKLSAPKKDIEEVLNALQKHYVKNVGRVSYQMHPKLQGSTVAEAFTHPKIRGQIPKMNIVPKEGKIPFIEIAHEYSHSNVPTEYRVGKSPHTIHERLTKRYPVPTLQKLVEKAYWDYPKMRQAPEVTAISKQIGLAKELAEKYPDIYNRLPSVQDLRQKSLNFLPKEEMANVSKIYGRIAPKLTPEILEWLRKGAIKKVLGGLLVTAGTGATIMSNPLVAGAQEVLTNPQELASGEIPPEFLAKQKAYLAAKKGQNANNR